MEKLETKRIGDVMYSKAGLKGRVLTYVGSTVLNRMPTIIERLVKGGFVVSQELLFDCLTVNVPSAQIDVLGTEYPLTADEAANIACPLLDEQIKQRIAGLNEFQMKDAMNTLNEAKAKVFAIVFKMFYYLNGKLGSVSEEMGLLLQVVEYKDGKLQYIKGFNEKLDELTAVYFKTQAAVDIYNQHVRAYEEMQKLYELIRNNFVRQTQCQPGAFIEFDFGEIGFPKGIDYELLAKRSGL